MGLPQYGGEGKKSYKGNKSDMKLKQHGGEGKHVSKKSSGVSYSPKRNESKDSPGRHLKTVKY